MPKIAKFWAIFKHCGEAGKSDSLGIRFFSPLSRVFRWQMAEFNLSSRKPLSSFAKQRNSYWFIEGIRLFPQSDSQGTISRGSSILRSPQFDAHESTRNEGTQAKLQESRHIQNLTAWHQLFSKLYHSVWKSPKNVSFSTLRAKRVDKS